MPGAVVPGAVLPGAVVLPGLDCVPGVMVLGEVVPEPVEFGLAVPGCALPDGEVVPDGLGAEGDALGVFTAPSESMQGVVLPGAVVPGNVLGGLAGDPGLFCEFDGLGVIPGTDPEPLFIGEHGGRLPGLCAPGVAVFALGVAVLVPGVAVLVPGVAVLAPGVAVLAPGVAVPGEEGVAVPGGVEVPDWPPGFAVPGELWLGEVCVWLPGVEVVGEDEVPAGFDDGFWAATAVATAKVPLSSMPVTIRFFFIGISKLINLKTI